MNRAPKQSGVATLRWEKADFTQKLTRRDRLDYFILVKRTIQEEDITIINIYVPNVDATNFIKDRPFNNRFLQKWLTLIKKLLYVRCYSKYIKTVAE